MFRILIATVILLEFCLSAQADELQTPRDVREELTLTASDYVADMPSWKPVIGDDLSRFVSHRIWGGLYFEDDPILGQPTGQALIVRVDGKRFSSQGSTESDPDIGELSTHEDKYCVYWKRYGELCYRVLFQKIKGKAAYLITRESGKVAFGIEILRD